MDVFSTVLGMGFHGTLGAMSGADFGRKGIAINAGVGAGGYLLGETVDDGSLGGAVLSGMISGSIQSGFSTIQEVYAFHNPGHISNVSSMNTTTTAVAAVEAMSGPFTKEGRQQLKDMRENLGKDGKPAGLWTGLLNQFSVNMATPENVLVDMAKYGMVYNQPEKGVERIMNLMGVDADEAKFNPWKAAKGFVNDTFETADIADNKNNSPWFSNKPVDIEVQHKTMFGEYVDAKGNPLNAEYTVKGGTTIHERDYDYAFGREKFIKDNNLDPDSVKYYYLDDRAEKVYSTPHKEVVPLTGKESIPERTQMFLNANRTAFDPTIEKFANFQENSGKSEVRFRNSEQLGKFLVNMEGGAIGTYKELQKAGFYDKDANLIKKTLAYGTETFTGSPAWARIASKQLEKGATIENYTTDDGRAKARIKGGSKGARIMGLIADVAMGGALNAAGNAAIWGVTAPFKSDAHIINSNNAVNPL